FTPQPRDLAPGHPWPPRYLPGGGASLTRIALRQPSAEVRPNRAVRNIPKRSTSHVSVSRTNQQGHCGLSPRRERYRFAGSPGRIAFRAHRTSLQAFRRSREGSSLASRLAEDGQPAPPSVELSEEFRQRPLQDPDRTSRNSQVNRKVLER